MYNAQRSIAVAPPMPRRAAREHRRWIGDGSPNHRRYYHIEYASPMFTRASPICRRCIADVSPMWMGHFWPWCTSPNVRRLLGAVRRYIADGIWRRNIGRKFQCMHWNFSRCPDALAKHGDDSRMSPIIRRTTGAWWAALAMPKFVHRESIGGLKKPRGTVALLPPPFLPPSHSLPFFPTSLLLLSSIFSLPSFLLPLSPFFPSLHFSSALPFTFPPTPSLLPSSFPSPITPFHTPFFLPISLPSFFILLALFSPPPSLPFPSPPSTLPLIPLLPSSLAPFFLSSLPSPPSLPIPPSVHPSVRLSIPPSLPPFLPSSLPSSIPLSLTPSLPYSLPPPSSLSPPSIGHSLPLSSLSLPFSPSLYLSLPPSFFPSPIPSFFPFFLAPS